MSSSGSFSRPGESRLGFLLPGPEASWGDPRDPDGPVRRLLGFLCSVACSSLIHERVIDELTSQAFRGLLREGTPSAPVRLLETLISARKVRVADLLGFVPAESPRAHQLTRELRQLLREFRRELGEPRTLEVGEGRPGAGDLLLEFLLEHFEGELVLAEPGSGPSTLPAASRPGPMPDGPAAHLLRRDGSRQPLHPFVLGESTPDGDRFWFLHDFDEARLRYLSADGTERTAQPAGFHADFVLEFFLKMGAYAEVREWLREMPGDDRAALNRRNILYAGFCHYGSLYLRQREYQQAVVELEKAVKFRPDLVLAHLHLAQAHMCLKQFDRAVEILKRHAVLFNRSDRLFELIGDCYRQKKDVSTALRMYEKAATLNPFNAQVEKKRGLLRQELQGNEKEAGAGNGSGNGSFKADELLVDLTVEAELGLHGDTVCRDDEIRQLVEILACRDKRNPLIVGEPGVGKTAIVEDFVLRLVQGRLPERFRGKKVYLMSVATLLAGAKFRGQFEERVLELVKYLKSQDCILFIDNMHAIVSSGLTRGGALDTSNILKPYLLRGEIQVIGTTTHEELRNTLEKDASLTRCFQVVRVDEPDLETAARMVAHVRGRYEAHHRILISEDVISKTLPVIDTCLRERAFPDKALEAIDRAGAIASLRLAEEDDPEAVAELTEDDLLAVVSELGRVPVARLQEDERRRLARLEEHLRSRVIGQEEALSKVSRVLRASRTGLVLDRRRPKGIFLFAGPTGVGKTELARAMAEVLFGSEERLVRIDMSEYMEKINQSRLIGTAPGYVGYNDSNQLTDEVRKNPHSLVLLDEIEKADATMLNLFLQVFDAGRLTDGKGRTVHFDGTTIVMTSNVGTELFGRTAVGFEEGRGGRGNAHASELKRRVERSFTPEFLNRIDEVVCFRSLEMDDVQRITKLKLGAFSDQLAASGKQLDVSEEAEAYLSRQGWSAAQGARHLERSLRRYLLEPLAERALETDWEEADLVRVDLADGVGADEAGLVFEMASGQPGPDPATLDLEDSLDLEGSSGDEPS